MLFKKAARAVWSNKKSYSACVFLIAIGIMMYLGMSIAADGLEQSILKFYNDYRLADVFAKVDAMPKSLADGLSEIEGVSVSDSRYVVEVRAEVSGSDELITLRLISLDTQNGPALNIPAVSGNPLSAENDIILNPAFINAHDLIIGDTVSVFLNGREYSFTLCASAISPEYAYITKSAGDILPDESAFGIGYISADGMSYLTNSAGVVNDLVFKLNEGLTFDDVKVALEDALSPYGLKELIAKEDLSSHAFVDMEVSGIKSMSASMPIVFVLISAVVLYLMMKRVIEQERGQIGTLKAFGYSNSQIMLHYLSYGGITGIAGGIFGVIFGRMLSGFYLDMFLQFFSLPGIPEQVTPTYYINAFIMAVGGGLAGAFAGALKALRLTPAAAMRPENPRPVKYDIVGKSKLLKSVLTSRGSMALRSIIRNPLRAGFVAVGVMFSYGLLAVSGSFSSLIDSLMFSQFTDIQRYDVKINFMRPLDRSDAVENAYAIEHVTYAEGLLEIPAELINKNIRAGTMITGIEQGSPLYRIYDAKTKKAFSPPADGVILTNGLAGRLGAESGDLIYISSYLSDDDIPVYVTGIAEQNLGSACYMDSNALAALFNIGETATSVILNTADIKYLKDYLKTAANAYSVEDKESTLVKYRNMMEPFSGIYTMMQIMSMLVAFAIIYNTSTISLSERKREYATLRVIGLSANEVTGIMSFEHWTLCFAGILLGIPFTLLLNTLLSTMVENDMFSMPSSLPAYSYLVGVCGCALAVILSNFSSKGKIKKFDMVEVLKERE